MKRTLSLVAIMLLGLSADAARAQSADGIKGVDDAWVAAAKKGVVLQRLIVGLVSLTFESPLPPDVKDGIAASPKPGLIREVGVDLEMVPAVCEHRPIRQGP